MIMTQETLVLKSDSLAARFADLENFVHTSAQQGSAAHEAERGLWQGLLSLGNALLGEFFKLQGTGDQGETMTLPTGQTCDRLPDLHRRRYVSIFGEFELPRTVYGSREGQKLEYVPLDNRLQLPELVFSFVLQDWAQYHCAEQAFGASAAAVERILGLKLSVDSLETMNLHLADGVTDFRDNRPVPKPSTEGAVVVCSADGKGIVMRRTAADPAPPAHRSKGEPASKKKMAIVGTVYTVDRYLRSAEEVVASLFRDKREKAADRPQPCHKRVWASLPQEDETGQMHSGLELVYEWMLEELTARNPSQKKATVYLHDGQEALWEAREDYLPAAKGTDADVLDLLHVTPRLWKAAHAFYREKSDEAEVMVRNLLLRVLQGKGKGVVRGLREMATKRGLRGAKKKTIEVVCRYLENNLERMRYDEYLAKGYPIASGVIEGACRHYVKDRMERAGMHWTPEGAQAMLDVRSTYVNGDWDEYQAYRIERESERLYPHRGLVAGREYAMAG